jgi:hypothetical protein
MLFFHQKEEGVSGGAKKTGNCFAQALFCLTQALFHRYIPAKSVFLTENLIPVCRKTGTGAGF